MTVQTTKNDPANRGDESHLELKNRIILTWLERMGVVQTFEGDELELEQDIIAIRELLASENEKEPSL